jgi:hypothetical protein
VKQARGKEDQANNMQHTELSGRTEGVQGVYITEEREPFPQTLCTSVG